MNNRRLILFSGLFLLLASLLSVTDVSGETLQQKSKDEFCSAVNSKFEEFKWYKIICNPERWEVYDYTARGNPLLYQEFGFEQSREDDPTNLLLCGVHGDEPSAIYQCFHLVREILFDNPEKTKGLKLVVAPIVNPDGFFLNTRQNGEGVDPNRNLPTRDWYARASEVWANYHKDPRKYPGDRPGSSVESRFQAYLIDRYQPDKVLSFHAPLGFLDFDGPGDRKYYNLVRIEQRAKNVGIHIEEDTRKFLRFVDYRFFPGSLGNYAGNERKIPTYTLELPSASADKAYDYWNIIKLALLKALNYHVYEGESRELLRRINHTPDPVVDRETKPFSVIDSPVISEKDRPALEDHNNWN